MAAAAPDLAHLARTARLALTDEEKARLAREVASILAHFEAVEGALGEAAAPGLAALEPRPDDPAPPEPAQVDAIVAQFPRQVDRLCKVPEGL